MGLRYSYTNDGGHRQVTVILNGRPVIVDDSHANFGAVLNACRANDEAKAKSYLNLDSMYAAALAEVGEGFGYADGVVTYNGEAVSQNLSDAITAVLTEKGDVRPFANFAKRIAANPGYRSRNALFAWINRHGLNINEDGFVIAYKGVTSNDAGDYVSIHQGYGIVNGETVEHGSLRNNVGDVVEVPRHKVDDDPHSHCSFGLHAGTHSYADGFKRGVLLTVKIDPADVVSVPSDGHKIRCCKYEVVAVTETAWTATVVWDGNPDAVASDWNDDQADGYWNQ
jgi:hypothetical protein